MFYFLVSYHVKKRLNSLFVLLIYLPLFWSFSGMLIYPDANKTQVILVLLSIASSFIIHNKKDIMGNIKENHLVRFLLVLTVGCIFLKLTHGYSSSVVRIFVCFLLYFSFVPKKRFILLKNKLPVFLFIASVISFSYGLWFTYVLDVGRAWSINPIPYSTVSVGISVGSLFILFSNTNKLIQKMMMLSFALSLNVIIFSQSRGTALALLSIGPLVVIFSYYLNLEVIRKTKFLFLIILASFWVNSGLVESRMDVTKNEIKEIESSNMNTSIGSRLQMWKAGAYLIKEKPILGYGDNHKQAKQSLVEQGIITQNVVRFTHYHNEYISVWAKNGLIGVMMLLSILYAPYFLFKRTIGKYSNNENPTCLYRCCINDQYVQQSVALVFIALGYSVAAITDVPFQHTTTIGFYISSCAVIFFGCESLND
jgi:O-antigen ligase